MMNQGGGGIRGRGGAIGSSGPHDTSGTFDRIIKRELSDSPGIQQAMGGFASAAKRARLSRSAYNIGSLFFVALLVSGDIA